MKRIIQFLPLVVCIGGLAIIVMAIREHREKKQDIAVVELPKPMTAVAPDSEYYTTQDQKLVQQVFDQPKMLDSTVTSNHAVADETTLPSSTFLVSRPFQDRGIHSESSNINRIQTSASYFDDFASLRTDTVCNPDSQKNQATVNSIMEKRQRRVNQLRLD